MEYTQSVRRDFVAVKMHFIHELILLIKSNRVKSPSIEWTKIIFYKLIGWKKKLANVTAYNLAPLKIPFSCLF